MATLPVRRAGAVIIGGPSDGAAWLLATSLEGAQLVRVEGPRLILSDTAIAAPWPQAPAGLRYRPGTNLVDGIGGADAPAAVVALDPAYRAAVREDGMLLLDATPAGIHVGGAVATPWPGVLLASGEGPPGVEDSLSAWRRRGDDWERFWSLSVPGAISALATRSEGRVADVVVAIETAAGAELLRLELRSTP